MKTITMSVILLLAVTSAYAAEGKSVKSYFETLLKGLKTKIQSRLESKNRVSAVAAVRGKEQGVDANALYWKGGVSEAAQKKLNEERKKLADAVQLVVDGGTAEGRAALEKFVKENRDSVYAQDAKEALANLPKEAAEPAAAEEKSKDEEAKPAAPGKSVQPAPKDDGGE